MFREEYPRPQFVRKNWTNLNGEWDFTFDDENEGIRGKFFASSENYDKKINVPFAYQSQKSGIHDASPHDIVWYYRKFEVSKKGKKRVIIHFGAVDYEADIFMNSQHILNHKGGHTSFSADITDYIVDGFQSLSVRVYDPHKDESIPRGKQFWGDEPTGIWYTSTTGIWQTVWLEIVEDVYIKNLRTKTLYDSGKVEFEITLNKESLVLLDYEITFDNKKVVNGTIELNSKKLIFDSELIQEQIFRTNYHGGGWSWTPERPNLFGIKFKIYRGEKLLDEVSSYFGMRKIHQENGMIYLNNHPYYEKLVLDQGYWPTGLMTAPTDEDFKKDIELSKEMGFNGCRKHQKVSDPRFLYWADKLGYLVWGECASPTIYNNDSNTRLMEEWKEIIERDFNHPSIVTWVPINESWGVPNISFDRQQQHFSQTMYHYLHSLDTTRLVVSNDGWALTETDICSIHNYNHGQKNEIEKYEYFKETLNVRENLLTRPGSSWPIFANGFFYKNQPILLTEFGGIGFDVSGEPGWGYTSVSNEDEFVEDYRRIMGAVYASKGLWGFCYTQITDVEQEINGLLTYERQPKCDLSKIKEINDSFHVLNVE